MCVPYVFTSHLHTPSVLYLRLSMQQPFQNRITQLFGIQYPIIQAGMIWASGPELATAVSRAGGLGLLGAGSMYPDQLRTAVKQVKAATNKPFGVNLPLLYPDAEAHIQTILEEKVPIVFTSAGNPKLWTPVLKEAGITVVHVVSSAKFAQKSEAAGVDAVVAEGFEAGGHNGREETTTLCLIPAVREAVKIPLIAAGGIATGRQMFATLALGAEAVQVGSRFVATPEASSHQRFKEAVVAAGEGDTHLGLKGLTPVRLLKMLSSKKFWKPKGVAIPKTNWPNCWAGGVPRRACGKAIWKKASWK